MSRRVNITTIDNPFNPFDDFNSWFMFDIEKTRLKFIEAVRIARPDVIFAPPAGMRDYNQDHDTTGYLAFQARVLATVKAILPEIPVIDHIPPLFWCQPSGLARNFNPQYFVDITEEKYMEIKDIIEQLYKEAKWVYNYLVRLIKVDGASSNAVCNRSSMAKVNRIPVYNKFTGAIETKKLKRLRSSQRVEIQQFVYTNVSRLRRKGLKISEALKFKSQITNIPLRQYRITHRIISHNKLKIQGITNKSNSSYLRVRGLDKIYNNNYCTFKFFNVFL